MDALYERNLDELQLTDNEDFLELIDHVLHPRAPQVYMNRPNHFANWNDKEFKARFRLEKEVVRFVTEQISDEILSATDKNHAVTSTEMVCTTLRFLATGSFLQVVGDFGGMDKSTACRKIHKVLGAIAGLSREFIKMPRYEYEINSVRQGFYNIARLPRCIGALNCTHIQSPGGPNAETYRNRKGFFSINVQAICNADLQFQDIVCRWPGSYHDSNIFRNSKVRNDFKNGVYNDCLLVANIESQISTRNPIERSFGVLKKRFPILALGIKLKKEKVEALLWPQLFYIILLCLWDMQSLGINEEIRAALELTNNINIQLQGGVNNNVRYA